MPVFNGEDFIREALDSILAQTFRDFELIISDNASTDGTEAICKVYAAQDSRIRYVRNPANIGPPELHNAVFRLARAITLNGPPTMTSATYFRRALRRDHGSPPTVVVCSPKASSSTPKAI
jgi:glycosyltransferase involved in cell wall biosynthesis